MLAEDKARISVAAVRPLFLQSNFQDDAHFIDHLKLTSHVNEALRRVSARGKDADLSYVDASEFPDGYLLVGRYRVDGSSVRITVTLFKGEKKYGNFIVEGKPADLDNIATKIVGEAQRLLRSSH